MISTGIVFIINNAIYYKSLVIKVFLVTFLISCGESKKIMNKDEITKDIAQDISETSLVVLGTIQDAGYPHIGCTREDCKSLFDNPNPIHKVVSLGVIDPENKKNWIFEATPDFPSQISDLQKLSPFEHQETPDGVFLTHAHIGHYSGLMYLGREALGANQCPVYAMPKMKFFLENNGPWDQLISLNNIKISPLENKETNQLSSNISVTPFLVPHRDEYSETVGYIIRGPSKSVLFIPDINKWDKWESNIVEKIKKVDYAFLDATFYDGEEINNRNISEIPHPFIIESMKIFNNMPDNEKNKIHFIHFNHTNPVLRRNSEQTKLILKNGFNIAYHNQIISL